MSTSKSPACHHAMLNYSCVLAPDCFEETIAPADYYFSLCYPEIKLINSCFSRNPP